MWQPVFKTALAAKSLVELTFACQTAIAGQVLAGMFFAVVGVAPHVWMYTRKVFDGPSEPQALDSLSR